MEMRSCFLVQHINILSQGHTFNVNVILNHSVACSETLYLFTIFHNIMMHGFSNHILLQSKWQCVAQRVSQTIKCNAALIKSILITLYYCLLLVSDVAHCPSENYCSQMTLSFLNGDVLLIAWGMFCTSNPFGYSLLSITVMINIPWGFVPSQKASSA